MVHQVSNYYGNQSYPQIQQDYANSKAFAENLNSTDKTVFCALQSLPPVRRISSLPDKLQNGDTLSALGLVGLMAVNFPEDCRDVKAAGKQIGSFIKGAKFEGAYNYKELQHPFSFFRGTLLHKFVDPNTAKDKKLARKLFKMDKTVADTTIGQKILNLLKTKFIGFKSTKIKQIGHTEIKHRFVEAKVFKGSAFGKLTARAMDRTPIISLAILAALELPKIFKAMNEGKNIAEQTGNTAKQTVKSGINVASITAGIAYGGAIGSKYGKAFGSLVGMGFGAILGGIASKKVQEVIF